VSGAKIEEMRALFDPDRKPFVVMDQDEYDKWTEWRKRTEAELKRLHERGRIDGCLCHLADDVPECESSRLLGLRKKANP